MEYYTFYNLTYISIFNLHILSFKHIYLQALCQQMRSFHSYSNSFFRTKLFHLENQLRKLEWPILSETLFLFWTEISAIHLKRNLSNELIKRIRVIQCERPVTDACAWIYIYRPRHIVRVMIYCVYLVAIKLSLIFVKMRRDVTRFFAKCFGFLHIFGLI